MLLKKGKVNPINALRRRSVNFPPAHFHYIILNNYSWPLNVKISTWITENLNGRFYIGQSIDLVDNSIIFVTKIGFEEAKELSFFNIACPHAS